MTDLPPSRKAFHEFLDFLREVDETCFGPDRFVTTPEDVAEGEHMLLHMMQAGLTGFVDNDASRPRFARIASAVMKWGGEGPDNPSHIAPLEPGRRYRITGTMSDEAYISFTVYTGKAEGDIGDGVISHMNHRDFTIDADGRFEIFIETAPTAGALHTEAGVPNAIVARHYWEQTQSAMADPFLQCHIDIECLTEPGYPRPLSSQAFADKLGAAQVFIRSQTLDRKMGENSPSWFSMTPNELPKPERFQPTEGAGAGATDNAYCACLALIEPDQAVIVTGRWPEQAAYANVCFWNRYQQSIDYRYRPGSLNRKQMQLNDEGSWTFVLAHQDPGVPNWLDTEGHTMGSIYFRFLLSEGELEQPVCQTVPFSQLKTSLA